MEKEILFTSDNAPLQINLIKIDDIYANWTKELRIIYVIDGKLIVNSNNNKYSITDNEFILINSYDFVSIQRKYSENTMFLELLIDNSIFNKFHPRFSNIKFKCDSSDLNYEKEKYDMIKKFISKIINVLETNCSEKNLLIVNILLELSLFLINNFKIIDKYSEKDISKHKVTMVLNFIEDNYENYDLTIYDIANHINFSSQYTLKLFRKTFGIGLIDYLNSFRIKKSINDLIYTDKSILEIAIDNGFGNSKSYHRLFKKEYNLTPGIYRKENAEKLLLLSNNPIFSKEELFKNFKQFLDLDIKYIERLNENEIISIEIDLAEINKKKINHYWKKILGLGKASEGLKSDIQYQVKETKSNIDFEYIRFHSVFNDDLFVYNEDERGNPYYNFAYIDKLIDFLVQIKLKPFINIGYMPKKLASKDEKFFLSNTSYPKDIEIWKTLVKSFIEHMIERYGEKEVSTWYFEIWNNPDLNKIYWSETDEKFLSFFEDTFSTIKTVSAKVKVGGPSVLMKENLNWIEKFLNMVKEKNLKIDFCSFHCYNITKLYKFETDKSLKLEVDSSLPKTTEELNQIIDNYYSFVKKNYDKKTDVFITEWSIDDPLGYNLVNDSCYISSYIINTVLNNFNTIKSLTYWTLTENKLNSGVFYGGLGLFTNNNLKKASYNSFLLLNKLGDELISKGKNHFITSNESGVQVLLYNHMELKNDDIKKSKEFLLNFKNLESGTYLITKYYLNSVSGSVYDAWLNMGSPEKITDEVFQLLKAKEKMAMNIEKKVVENNLYIKDVIMPNGIIFLDIQMCK